MIWTQTWASAASARLCMHLTAVSSEEGEEEASGTLGSTPMVIVPEHWIRPSVSPDRLVDLAASESAGSSPQSNYYSTQ